MRRLELFSIFACFLMACGSDSGRHSGTSDSTDAGRDAAAEDSGSRGEDSGAPARDAGGDAAVPEPGLGVDLTPGCEDAGMDEASIDVSCSVAADCSAVLYTLNCCGSQAITGVNVKDAARAQELADDCAAPNGLCECATLPIKADDGTHEAPGYVVRAECVEQRCRTTFRATEDTPCGPDKTCDSQHEICVYTEAFTGSYECVELPDSCAGDHSCDCGAEQICGVGILCADGAPNVANCYCPGC